MGIKNNFLAIHGKGHGNFDGAEMTMIFNEIWKFLKVLLKADCELAIEGMINQTSEVKMLIPIKNCSLIRFENVEKDKRAAELLIGNCELIH